MNIINPKYLNLEYKKEEFLSNKPFPYLILDNFLEKNYYKELDSKLSKNNYFKGGKN